jgi:hypothetical protein
MLCSNDRYRVLIAFFQPMSHSEAKNPVAAILCSAPSILGAVKEALWRFMFMCTCGLVLNAKRKVAEK